MPQGRVGWGRVGRAHFKFTLKISFLESKFEKKLPSDAKERVIKFNRLGGWFHKTALVS